MYSLDPSSVRGYVHKLVWLLPVARVIRNIIVVLGPTKPMSIHPDWVPPQIRSPSNGNGEAAFRMMQQKT